MSLPLYNSLFSALSSARLVAVNTYLTIEGIPFAFGLHSTANWTGVTDPRQLRDAMVNVLHELPKGLSQKLDTMQGGNLSAESLTVTMIDADNILTALTNTGTPSRKLITAVSSPTATTIRINDTTDLNAGDYIYIGLETIKIGTVASGTDLTGCTRGCFGSKQLVPVNNAYSVGFPVGTSPYTLAGRRMYLWSNFYTNVREYIPGTHALTDAAVRFAGVIRQFSLDNDRNLYVMRCDSIDKEIDRQIFTKQRTFDLRYGPSIKDAKGENGMITGPGMPGDLAPISNAPTTFNSFQPSFSVGTTNIFANNEVTLCRIDDEIFALRYIQYTGFVILARGLYGTEVVAHDTSAQVHEIVPVVAQDTTSTDWAAKISKFRIDGGTPTLLADHPIALALQFLLSVYGNSSANGLGPNGENYDVLPYGWGLAIDRNRVDVEGMLAAASEDPSLRWTGFVDAPMNFVDFLRDMLTFCGYYFTTVSGGVLTIRKLRYPMPDQFTAVIDTDRIIKSGAPSWDANFAGAIRRLDFKFSWDYNTEKYRNVVVFLNNDADIYSRGMAKEVSYESKFIHKANPGVPNGNLFVPFDVDTWLLSRADYIRSRYGKPPPIVRVTVDYAFLMVDIGSMVTLTDPNTPDQTTGTRGINALVGEIIGKEPRDDSRTVVLTLAMTPAQLGTYRYLDLSGRIDNFVVWDDGGGGGIANGDPFALDANTFSHDLFVDSAGDFGPAGWIYLGIQPFMRFLPLALRGNIDGPGRLLQWRTIGGASQYGLAGYGDAMKGFYNVYEFEVHILDTTFADNGDYMSMQFIEFGLGNGALAFDPATDSSITSFDPNDPSKWVGRYLVSRVREANLRIPDLSPMGTMSGESTWPDHFDNYFPG